MAKYNYDKSVLKGLGVSNFLNEVKLREKHIAEADDKLPTSVYNPNIVANKLHPGVQFGVVKKVIELEGAKSYVIGPNTKMGTEKLAYFRAGQYVSIELEFDGAYMCKPYSLCGCPKDALKKGLYTLTIKKNSKGYASDYIINNWKVGTKITMSGPLGDFYYTGLRDEKNVIAVAGGSGITPFVSMAQAIATGDEDFNLTILYGSKDRKNILLRDVLDACAKKKPNKIKIVNVLSEEKVRGYEYGLISAELIKKYAPKDNYSIFVCGPKAMYTYEEKEIAKLKLPKRRVRFELSGEYGDPSKDKAYPKDAKNKVFNVKVWVRGEATTVTCKANETLLHAMETAGIRVPSDCRSGQCGWCHSRLIKGKTYIPEKNDGRRLADKKFNWIHPCATYPLSNIELEVFPLTK